MNEQMSITHMMLMVSNSFSVFSWLLVKSDQNQVFLVQILVQPIIHRDTVSQGEQLGQRKND
jgi:hypothetical protein